MLAMMEVRMIEVEALLQFAAFVEAHRGLIETIIQAIEGKKLTEEQVTKAIEDLMWEAARKSL